MALLNKLPLGSFRSVAKCVTGRSLQVKAFSSLASSTNSISYDDFPVLPPRIPKSPRKKPSKMVVPQESSPPMVASHPQHRSYKVPIPGRRRIARILGDEHLAKLEQYIQSQVNSGSDESLQLSETTTNGSNNVIPYTSILDKSRLSARHIRRINESLDAHKLTFPPTSVSDPKRLFAVVNVKGKQYKISENDIINAEYMPEVDIAQELVVVPNVVGGISQTVVGRPTIPGASVKLAVEEHAQDTKVVVYKKRRRKRYQKTQGHRRMVTRLRVMGIDIDLSRY